MNIILPKKKKIIIFGKKKSSILFFINKNFKNIVYNNKKYYNDYYNIYRSSNIEDFKTKFNKVDKIYYISDYNTNYSNFPINERDIIFAKELISFLYEDLKFKDLLTIILIPTFIHSNNNLDNVHNYFNFTDKANIEVLKYNEDCIYNTFYTASTSIKKLYYMYNYKNIISKIQEYMIDNNLYPDVNMNLVDRIYYKHTNPIFGNIVLYKKMPNKTEYNAVIYYDILKKKKCFEGKFFDNTMKSGSFYSEDGELLFKGCI
jgi:hypothetical protein